MRSRKFIPAKFLKSTIRESLYLRKLILALGDRESLSLRKFPPAKVDTSKSKVVPTKVMNQKYRCQNLKVMLHFSLGEQHGIHGIVVPIRDDELNHLPGVLVEDMGFKMGVNGVDNAKLR